MNQDLIPIADVSPHEEVDASHVDHIMTAIVTDRVIKRPLIVARGCKTLLDGHHRYHALRLLEVDFLPCVVVDYDDRSLVEVDSWREGEVVTREIIRSAAASNQMLPIKTSRHMLKFAVPLMGMPLADLFTDNFDIREPVLTQVEKESPCAPIQP
ncbi:ParB N-terminal domain-containing protein [Sulfitobacter sp. F26169L]|uniref:ParB N-terminal domain-containing protein n=1 Tax=Sulfitobacter sp. F26169L TaxID=2996015 RepID=UPI002260B989|nr:ParB N-terminal domain-containing protein [Sulfitobacter sp. F26169L]MCX7567706.1 ParB N-terminal domain-containing protein [Sulfitobacter sp. F26169L]